MLCCQPVDSSFSQIITFVLIIKVVFCRKDRIEMINGERGRMNMHFSELTGTLDQLNTIGFLLVDGDFDRYLVLS